MNIRTADRARFWLRVATFILSFLAFWYAFTANRKVTVIESRVNEVEKTNRRIVLGLYIFADALDSLTAVPPLPLPRPNDLRYSEICREAPIQ